MMFAEQRKSIIIDLINQNGSVSLNKLVELLGVSKATIRRDLTELEQANHLQRTHGGAVSSNLSVFEADYSEKELEFLEEKRHIAKIAAELINEGDTVLLDSGTTTFEIARAIRNKKITLITNSATIIADMMHAKDCKMEIVSTGGIFRTNFRAFIGTSAEDFIRNIVPDKVFIAANGFSVKRGATTPNMTEASIKRVMIASGKKIFLVADSSKVNKEYLSIIVRPTEFDGIITDKKIDDLAAQDFRAAGVPVLTEIACTTITSEGDSGMDISEILSTENMTLDLKAHTREEAISELMDLLYASGAISDKEEMVKAALKREEEFSTGIGMQVAIPHAKSRFVKRAAIAFGRNDGVEWPTEDGINPCMIFLIVVPLEARNQHLQLLAQISRKIIHKEVRQAILNAPSKECVINAFK
jgi:DeoR family fructose operon transcriptional repressor